MLKGYFWKEKFNPKMLKGVVFFIYSIDASKYLIDITYIDTV